MEEDVEENLHLHCLHVAADAAALSPARGLLCESQVLQSDEQRVVVPLVALALVPAQAAQPAPVAWRAVEAAEAAAWSPTGSRDRSP